MGDVQRIYNPELEDENYNQPGGLAWRTINAPETRYPENPIISPKNKYPNAVDEYANKLNETPTKKGIFSFLGFGGKKSRKSRKSRKSKKSRKSRKTRRRRRM